MSHRPSRLVLIAALLLAALLLPVPAAPAPAAQSHSPAGTVDVQLLAINDFHGNLEPPGGTCLSGRRRAARRTWPRTSASSSDGVRNNTFRQRRRHDRRQPAALGPLPRQGHDRRDEPDRPRATRASATTTSTRASPSFAGVERRLPSGGRGRPGRRRLRRRELPVPRRQRRRHRDRRDRLPHRPVFKTFGGVKIGFVGMTLEGTAKIVSPPAWSDLGVPRRGRDGRHRWSPAPPQRGGVDRGPAPRGRLHDRRRATTAPGSVDRSSTSSPASTTRSTPSSRATPTSAYNSRCPTPPATRSW